MDHLRVPVTMTVAQINRVLTILGKSPYDEVYDIVSTLKSQGDSAIRQANDANIEQLIKDRTK